MKALVLIGMMGVGKSSIGAQLAHGLGIPFYDTDSILQAKLGRSINSLFSLFGEQAFRDHESLVIQSLNAEPSVISTGGGAVLRSENWDHLTSIGRTVYLRATADILIPRLEKGRMRRPLLAGDDWKDVLATRLAERDPVYARAELIFDVDNEPAEETAHRLMQTVRELGWAA
jgi:shikimate kinase